jgi:hypothetical protein
MLAAILNDGRTRRVRKIDPTYAFAAQAIASGTSVEGIKARDRDVFEVEAATFGLPLRNPLLTAPASPVVMRSL